VTKTPPGHPPTGQAIVSPLLSRRVRGHRRKSQYHRLTAAGRRPACLGGDRQRLAPRSTVLTSPTLPTRAHTLGQCTAAGRGGLCLRPGTGQTPMATHPPHVWPATFGVPTFTPGSRKVQAIGRTISSVHRHYSQGTGRRTNTDTANGSLQRQSHPHVSSSGRHV